MFNKMLMHYVVTWTAMLKGYSMCGLGKEAFKHFEQMFQASVEMDQVTFIYLLLACTHVGLVDEGFYYFESMGLVYGVLVAMEHYTCIIDIFGHVCLLQDTKDFFSTISCELVVSVWVAFFGACKIHHNMEMGEHIAKQLVKSDPRNVASYVILSNIYVVVGKWDLSANFSTTKIGHTWIEMNNEIHTLIVDDQDHPQMVEIHVELKRLLG
jgi:pentatricopeptide repeat protein